MPGTEIECMFTREAKIRTPIVHQICRPTHGPTASTLGTASSGKAAPLQCTEGGRRFWAADLRLPASPLGEI